MVFERRSTHRLSAHSLTAHHSSSVSGKADSTVPLGIQVPRAELVSNKVASKLAQLLKVLLLLHH